MLVLIFFFPKKVIWIISQSFCNYSAIIYCACAYICMHPHCHGVVEARWIKAGSNCSSLLNLTTKNKINQNNRNSGVQNMYINGGNRKGNIKLNGKTS